MKKIKINGQSVSKGVGKGNAIKINVRSNEKYFHQTGKPVILIIDNLNRDIYKYISDDVKGVVARKGSVGCHGAGILREFKIPCVVRCSSIFSDAFIGKTAEVNGEDGSVTIFSIEVENVPETLSDQFDLIEKNNKIEKTENRISENKTINRIKISGKTECYRPGRKYQKLRFDMLKKGWEESPNYLFGLSSCKLELSNDNEIIIHNGPDLNDIKNYILNNIEWFYKIGKERQKNVEKWKNDLAKLNDHVNYKNRKSLKNAIISLVEIYTGLLRYIYLTQFVANDLIDEWASLLDKFIKGSENLVSSFLKSEYNRKSIINKNYPGKSTYWILPSQDPHIWEGEVIFDIAIPTEEQIYKTILMKSINSGSDIILLYCRYRMVIPIVYQMAEEHYYVSSSICSYLNRALENVTNIIYGPEKSPEYRSQIYLHSLDDLISLLNKI